MCVCFVLCCYGVCKSFDWQSGRISCACRGACVICRYEIWQLCKEKYGMLHGHLYTDMVYRHGSALYLKILRLGQYQKAWSGAVFQGTVWLNPVRDMGIFFCNCAHADSDCFTFSAYRNKKQENICTVCVGKYAFLDDNTHTA